MKPKYLCNRRFLAFIYSFIQMFICLSVLLRNRFWETGIGNTYHKQLYFSFLIERKKNKKHAVNEDKYEEIWPRNIMFFFLIFILFRLHIFRTYVGVITQNFHQKRYTPTSTTHKLFTTIQLTRISFFYLFFIFLFFLNYFRTLSLFPLSPSFPLPPPFFFILSS